MKRKAPGILPNCQWLRDHGYTGLMQAMRRDPRAFSHIQQADKARHTPAEWVMVAGKLAKEHGKLPHHHWLVRHGYNGLAQARRNHPQLFVHIRQARGCRRPEDWISVAESLANRHGKLPCSGWLRRNGYGTLDKAIRTHPAIFRHIAKDWKGGRSLRDWVTHAEMIAAEHGGTIPCASWLIRNHHPGLYKMLLEHPKVFRHIRRERRPLIKADKWVIIAERLAKKDGILPKVSWLSKHYGGLYAALRAYPHLFVHIKQHKKHRKPKEWVEIAEGLAKKYDKLPNPQWLTDNGFNALRPAMKAHPELFAHINQKKLVRR